MPNYEMKFSVVEAASKLKVEKDLVKRWAYLFRDYLRSPANPPKGNPRQFCAEDLRVLAYVAMDWEDDPDIESIKRGLNAKGHYEEIINDFMTSRTPIFIDPPEELNENWRHGSLIGGFAEVADTFALADSYKIAGDRLIDAALSNDEASELIRPIIYIYRHATELYLKAIIVPSKKDHDLGWLLEEFRKLLESEFPKLDTKLPSWFEDVILGFADFDPNGTTFRYGGDSSTREAWVYIERMKTRMGWMAEAFHNIRTRRRGERSQY